MGLGVERESIGPKAVELAESPRSGLLTRITALQVCAALGERTILNTAMNLAADHKNTALRSSAFAAVGVLGGANETDWLKRQLSTSDQSVQPAVEAALNKNYAKLRLEKD